MEEERKTKAQIISDGVCGILMLLSIIAYLIVGFTANIWHPTWLIIVCTALVCGIIGVVSNTVARLKNNENKNNENKDNS